MELTFSLIFSALELAFSWTGNEGKSGSLVFGLGLGGCCLDWLVPPMWTQPPPPLLIIGFFSISLFLSLSFGTDGLATALDGLDKVDVVGGITPTGNTSNPGGGAPSFNGNLSNK